MGFKVGKLLESICMLMHCRHHKTTAGHHRHHCRHHFVYVNVTNVYKHCDFFSLHALQTVPHAIGGLLLCRDISWDHHAECLDDEPLDNNHLHTHTQTHACWAREQLLVTRSSYYASQWSHRAVKLSHSVILLSVHQDISCLSHHSYLNHHLSKSFLEGAASFRDSYWG